MTLMMMKVMTVKMVSHHRRAKVKVGVVLLVIVAACW